MSEVEELNVPKGWVKSPLRDISEKLVDGSHNPPKKQESGFPMLSARNIENGLLNWDANYRFITEEGFELENKRTNIEADDVLLTIVGTIGRACVVPKSAPKFTLQRSVAVIKPIEIDPKYICYQLQSSRVQHFLHKNSKGTAQKGIYLKGLGQLDILIAPPEQQKRIVAKIEELFSHIDAGIEALKKAKQLLKQYRQSVLKAAVTGELTKEWREANKAKLEPASDLLKRIEEQRKYVFDKEIKKWKELVVEWEKSNKKEKKPAKPKKPKSVEPLSNEELAELDELPNGWLWVKLSQIVTKITDGEHFKPPVQEDGICFLSAKDVRDEGVSFENPLYISEETASKALLRCNPEQGDILIVSRGATVGRMCVVNTDETFCLLGSVILVKVTEGVDSQFLMNLMKSPDVNRKISNVSGATAQQAIYLRDIQHVAVPICSIEEQKEIDRVVSEKTDSIARLEKEIETKITLADKNKQSILVSAFSGSFQ